MILSGYHTIRQYRHCHRAYTDQRSGSEADTLLLENMRSLLGNRTVLLFSHHGSLFLDPTPRPPPPKYCSQRSNRPVMNQDYPNLLLVTHNYCARSSFKNPYC